MEQGLEAHDLQSREDVTKRRDGRMVEKDGHGWSLAKEIEGQSLGHTDELRLGLPRKARRIGGSFVERSGGVARPARRDQRPDPHRRPSACRVDRGADYLGAASSTDVPLSD